MSKSIYAVIFNKSIYYEWISISLALFFCSILYASMSMQFTSAKLEYCSCLWFIAIIRVCCVSFFTLTFSQISHRYLTFTNVTAHLMMYMSSCLFAHVFNPLTCRITKPCFTTIKHFL